MEAPLIRRGIDVSNNNGDIDWDRVARSYPKVGFLFIKATEGLGYVDPLFTKARVDAVRKAGIPFGIYHFARPQPGRDGADEADAFVLAGKKAGWGKIGDLRGVLDIEHSDGVDRAEVQRFVRRFIKRYRHLTGHRPIIYTGSFWRDFLGNPIMATRCPLWLAAYTDTWNPWVPKAWIAGRPFIWQRSQTGTQTGITGYLDINRFLRNRRAWKRIHIKHNL